MIENLIGQDKSPAVPVKMPLWEKSFLEEHFKLPNDAALRLIERKCKRFYINVLFASGRDYFNIS